MRFSRLFVLFGLVSSSLATACYQAMNTDAPFGVPSGATSNQLSALRQTICLSWTGPCDQMNNGPSGDGTAKSMCWNQDADNNAVQAIMFGPNPTDNNGCLDAMQHIIDDCLTKPVKNGTGILNLNYYGLTGLYKSNENVYVMTRVGNQDWGMQP